MERVMMGVVVLLAEADGVEMDVKEDLVVDGVLKVVVLVERGVGVKVVVMMLVFVVVMVVVDVGVVVDVLWVDVLVLVVVDMLVVVVVVEEGGAGLSVSNKERSSVILFVWGARRRGSLSAVP